jgi:CubicO group peptidase (beta-lactamase class C family)
MNLCSFLLQMTLLVTNVVGHTEIAFGKLLQDMLQAWSIKLSSQYKKDVALQLSWKSGDHNIALAAGRVRSVGGSWSRAATVNDTFIFGSGTKTVTAAAVMRLIDAGKIQGDDLASVYIDPFLMRNHNSTMAQIFGAGVETATVLQLIRMAAGIPDFEPIPDGAHSEVDSKLLLHGNKDFSPYWFLQKSAKILGASRGLLCAPGKCSGYSSTSFELAGLLLASVLGPEGGDWDDFDLAAAAFGKNVDQFASLQFPPFGHRQSHGGGSGIPKISDTVSVPGQCVSSMWGSALIVDQHPSILGWTCGNMCGRTRDVAKFNWDLFKSMRKKEPDDLALVSASALSEMTRLTPTTAGWAKGLQYGAGVMGLTLSQNATDYKKSFMLGHEGTTFGFDSLQGFLPRFNASFSIALNIDATTARYVACNMLEVAETAIFGLKVNYNCGMPLLKKSSMRGPQTESSAAPLVV